MTAETFHPDSEVPGGDNFNDSATISLGLYFTVGVSGTVTHARWRAAPLLTGLVKWALYRLSDSLQLVEQDISSYTPGAWNNIPLTTPVAILPATEYVAVVWIQNYYVATSGYFSNAITRGDITAEAAGGRFTEPSPDITLPSSNFNGCYFVDVVFAPDGSTTPFTKTVTESYRVLNSWTKTATEQYRVLGSWTFSTPEAYRVLGAWSLAVSDQYRVLNGWSLSKAEAYRVLSAWTKTVIERYTVGDVVPPPPHPITVQAYLGQAVQANLNPITITANLDEV